jgi:hypothetical protein
MWRRALLDGAAVGLADDSVMNDRTSAADAS